MKSSRKRTENWAALPLVAPFVVVYGALFVYPGLQMLQMSFTSASLAVPGEWVGLANYAKLLGDRVFGTAIRNTLFFVAMTVVPGTILGLALAMLVNRLNGIWRAIVLAAFFLPYVLPVSTITTIAWALTSGDGPLSDLYETSGRTLPIWYNLRAFLPSVAVLTVWWTVGFNVMIFLAGLKMLPQDLYDAAKIDGAGRWTSFTSVTLPLMWPVTAVVITIQIITHFKVFDQVFLLVAGGRTEPNMVLVQYIYTVAFIRNQGGYASAVAFGLFAVVLTLSALQIQLMRLGRAK